MSEIKSPVQINMSMGNNIGAKLQNNLLFKIGEILLLFAAAFGLIKLLEPLAADSPVLKQAVVWVANILMLLFVWAGLKIRGQSWNHFGLSFKKVSGKEALRVFLLSLLVFLLAVTGFVIGSIIMANITGIPEEANFSSYEYLENNIGMLILTLLGVFIVSSFGEEVVYRGFLINRIEEFGFSPKAGRVIAVIVSSVMFGFVHFDWGPMGIAQTGFMGLALAICYIKLKRRLWILIIAHAYMDTILMVQMYMASN